MRRQILEAVRSGRLEPGARLPTVRGLADDIGLATNTVARAYRELERDGVIETHGRSGSFISADDDTAVHQATLAATAFAVRVHELGVGSDEALALVTQALKQRSLR
ncbi:MAG: GntR family transcriptional regulator [Cryobacterium sp.]